MSVFFDPAKFGCTKCGASMRDGCDCWVKCPCGWSYERGEECWNEVHRCTAKRGKQRCELRTGHDGAHFESKRGFFFNAQRRWS